MGQIQAARPQNQGKACRRFLNLRRGLGGHGICICADVAGIVVQRVVLDGHATAS